MPTVFEFDLEPARLVKFGSLETGSYFTFGQYAHLLGAPYGVDDYVFQKVYVQNNEVMVLRPSDGQVMTMIYMNDENLVVYVRKTVDAGFEELCKPATAKKEVVTTPSQT